MMALEPLLRATLRGRTGRPHDVASTAPSPASDDGGSVTGQWISPNGGLILC